MSAIKTRPSIPGRRSANDAPQFRDPGYSKCSKATGVPGLRPTAPRRVALRRARDTNNCLTRFLVIALLGLSVAITSRPANAEPVADFYRGKTISLYVGFPPGGGYDIYARVLAAHLGRHLPGQPAILVRNMDGGSGVRAAGYISSVTPQDGTALGMFLDGLTLGKVLGGPGDFDPIRLTWIGRIASTATVAVVWHTAPGQSVADAKTREIIVAASVPGSTSSIIPLALNDLIGTKFKVIRGFQGSPKQSLAMERGEVHAIGAMAWEAIQAGKQEWLTDNKIRILYVHGARRIAELPNDPAVVEFAQTDQARSILRLVSVGPDIGRAIAAEPRIPAERAAALRQAFTRTMADPDFVADMRKRNLDIGPLTGEALQSIVAAAVATPRELIDQVQRYSGP
jgi:tripartite-type tricarboxylate transporter receptor subunit TctC